MIVSYQNQNNLIKNELYTNLDDIELGQTNKNLEFIESVETNYGLLTYLSNVYLFSGIGWCSILIFSELLSLSITKNNFNTLLYVYLFVGFIIGLFSILGTRAPSKIITLSNGDKKELIQNWKIYAFGIFTFGSGMMLSIIVYFINLKNSIIFPISIVANCIIFTLVQIIVMRQKTLDDIKYFPLLTSCASSLIIIGTIQFILVLINFNIIYQLILFTINIVSSVIYTGLIYVNTFKAIESYEKSELNSIKYAVEVIFDLFNLH